MALSKRSYTFIRSFRVQEDSREKKSLSSVHKLDSLCAACLCVHDVITALTTTTKKFSVVLQKKIITFMSLHGMNFQSDFIFLKHYREGEKGSKVWSSTFLSLPLLIKKVYSTPSTIIARAFLFRVEGTQQDCTCS